MRQIPTSIDPEVVQVLLRQVDRQLYPLRDKLECYYHTLDWHMAGIRRNEPLPYDHARVLADIRPMFAAVMAAYGRLRPRLRNIRSAGLNTWEPAVGDVLVGELLGYASDHLYLSTYAVLENEQGRAVRVYLTKRVSMRQQWGQADPQLGDTVRIERLTDNQRSTQHFRVEVVDRQMKKR